MKTIESGKDKRILVHVCCAPCAAPSIERIRLDDWREVALYFSNSNIYPQDEYDKRLEYVRRLSEICQVFLETDLYDHDTWLAQMRGLENEPEKGKRCLKCFEFNLRRTSMLAEATGYDAFTTTLTLGPHKISRMVFSAGEQFSRYVPYDFKKQNGFVRSLQLSQEYDLYRQGYCGCEFSRRVSQ